MKHTPGPWIVYNDDDLAHSVLQAISRGDICRIGYYPSGIDATVEEINANARLIAASPDLLEACKAAKKHLEPDLVEPGRTVFWSLVSAIAKAEVGGAE